MLKYVFNSAKLCKSLTVKCPVQFTELWRKPIPVHSNCASGVASPKIFLGAKC